MSQDEISVWIGRESKVDCTPQHRSASFNLFRRSEENKKGRGRENVLTLPTVELDRQSFCAVRTGLMPLNLLPWASVPSVTLHHLLCWSSHLQMAVLCGAVLSHPVLSDSLRPHGLLPARLLCPWDSPGKNTAAGCHALLQGIFMTQGSNPGLPHCRWILYHLRYQGSPCSWHITGILIFCNSISHVHL